MTWENRFCAGTRRDGKPCGRKVQGSGSKISGLRCWQHRGRS